MNSIQLRFLLFLLFCITTRVLLVILAKYVDKYYLPYLGGIAVVIAVSFLVIYLGGYRRTGLETMGQTIWWNNLRPVHAILYLTFAVLAFRRDDYSWVPLAVDVVIGFTAFMVYHGYSGNFKKLIK